MVKAYVADWKKDEVSQLQDFVKSADVVGLVDVSGIGAKQMLDMRASLRDLGVKLRMSRNRLLKRALETSSKDKKGVEQVIEEIYKENVPHLQPSKESIERAFTELASLLD